MREVAPLPPGDPAVGAPASEERLATWRETVRARVGVGAALFALWTLVIAGRLVQLQVIEHEELVARAERQQLRTIVAPAKRGEIRDRHGRVLALSVEADSIYAVPTEIPDPARWAARLCRALEGCDAREQATLADRLGRQRAFAFVRRQVSPDEARRVAELNLEGIGFLKEYRRYYPKLELAAHVLGYVGTEHQGLHGIEASYDLLIRGRPGQILVQTDARRRAFSRIERPPTAGATLELTLDQYLQYVAERELQAAVASHRAAGGTIIVMDPHSGEIYALANAPTFNPNAFRRAPEAHRRNRAVQEIYEPGSTFKIVTASAALEEGVVDLDDPVDVSPGFIRVGSRQIDDVHPYGTLSFAEVLVRSSNVGAVKVGLRLGAERLGRYLWRFGFGQVLSRDLPGESAGIVWNPARWSDSALASVSMGYQVGVTPLQMAAAASVVANGGELVRPRLVRAVVRQGVRTPTTRQLIRRAIRPETAAALTAVMERVVRDGTGRAARVEGFTVAGKTGTAAKLVGGRYSRTDYHASFVGFVPSRRPVLTILVVIDTPRVGGYYGGVVAAPVFKRVADAALRYLGVPPTEAPSPVILAGAGPAPHRPERDAGAWALQPVTVVRTPAGVMPDVRGLGAREAVSVVVQHGLTARVDGDGVVHQQDPPPGTPLERGATCWLKLARATPPVSGSRP
jgi:cell division protein FtsI (penicillin-binding protein 3)